MVWIMWWVVVIVTGKSVLGWNFVPLNTTNDEVTILHISTYYMRAFISIQSDLDEVKGD